MIDFANMPEVDIDEEVNVLHSQEAKQRIKDQIRKAKFEKVDGLPSCKKPRVVEQEWIELPGDLLTFGQSVLVQWEVNEINKNSLYHLESFDHNNKNEKGIDSWIRIYSGTNREFRTTIEPGEAFMIHNI